MLVAISSGFGMQYTVLIPVFARDLLHAARSGYGFLMAAQGLGAVSGAIVDELALHRRLARCARTWCSECSAWRLRSACFGVSPSMPISLLAQMFIGVGLMNHMVTTNTMLQLFVSDELRGRVMSLYTLSFIGTAPLGSLEVGFIGEHLSPRTAVLFCAMFSLLCGFILLTKLKLIAHAQAEIEQTTVRG